MSIIVADCQDSASTAIMKHKSCGRCHHDSPLPTVSSYRDLGITIINDFAPSTHKKNNIIEKSHQRANMIIRCFVSSNTDLLVRAFTPVCDPCSLFGLLA